MKIALVIGSTISTIKEEVIRGRKLLIVRKAHTTGAQPESFIALWVRSAWGLGDGDRRQFRSVY
jgi:microcompartment protein CcmK/EutM